jgi:hypothetical protein
VRNLKRPETEPKRSHICSVVWSWYSLLPAQLLRKCCSVLPMPIDTLTEFYSREIRRRNQLVLKKGCRARLRCHHDAGRPGRQGRVHFPLGIVRGDPTPNPPKTRTWHESTGFQMGILFFIDKVVLIVFVFLRAASSVKMRNTGIGCLRTLVRKPHSDSQSPPCDPLCSVTCRSHSPCRSRDRART